MLKFLKTILLQPPSAGHPYKTDRDCVPLVSPIETPHCTSFFFD